MIWFLTIGILAIVALGSGQEMQRHITCIIGILLVIGVVRLGSR